MKEQSWWSNNLLPLSIVVLVICGLTAGTAGVVKWLAPAFKSSRCFVDKKQQPYTPPKSLSTQTSNAGVFGPYMQQIQHDIKSKWYPPKRNISRRVTVLFKVDRQGHISNLKVTPSGDEELDKSAREAVIAAAPFAKLPAESKEKSVDIQFTFDYNVYEQNRKQTH